MFNLRHLALLCCFLSFWGKTALATDYSVIIVDQNGNAVPNAVVAYPGVTTSSENLDVAIMDQIDKQFSPRVIAIQKGQAVKFPNSDDIRHHVYSFSPVKRFEIKLYSGSNVDPIVFDKPGIGVLGCNIHDDMIGHVYIADGETTAVTNAQGIANFANAIPAEVSVWHADMSLDGSLKTKVALSMVNDRYTGAITLITREPKKEQRTFGSRTFGRNN